MKPGEKGYTLIELVMALAIMVLVSGAAATVIFQVCRGTGHNNDYTNTVRQLQNAGYWISRDAQMAQSTLTANLTAPDFLVLNWTEWDAANEPEYHSATYYFEDITDGTGRLKRHHWSSAGANEQTLVAEHIYYDPGDPDDTSQVSYQSPVLTVRLTALFAETMETREYRISHRPNL